MEEKMAFVSRYLGGERVTDLANEFGISRQSGHALIKRFEQFGAQALTPRSSRPHHSPYRTPKPKVDKILQLRRKHPTWGAKKIKARLQDLHPEVPWPAHSTIGVILKDAGLIKSRKRRRSAHPTPSTERRQTDAPNQLWCIDYKGQFVVGNGRWCYPFTVTDHYSRYLLGCDAYEKVATKDAQTSLKRLFKRYGLPDAVRSDNGSPFASTGRAGLTKLSVWMMRLGIDIERIEPGRPDQNGRHERFHLTLKQDTIRPAAESLMAQQQRFNRFQNIYNDVRPHEALGMKTPASAFSKSRRVFPESLPPLSYPLHDRTLKVWQNGKIELKRVGRFRIGAAFAGENIGLRQVNETTWLASFMDFDVAYLCTKTNTTLDVPN